MDFFVGAVGKSAAATLAFIAALIAGTAIYWISWSFYIPGDSLEPVYFRYPAPPPRPPMRIEANGASIFFSDPYPHGTDYPLRACANISRPWCKGTVCPSKPDVNVVLKLLYPLNEYNVGAGPINVELILNRTISMPSRPFLIPRTDWKHSLMSDLFWLVPVSLGIISDTYSETIVVADFVRSQDISEPLEICLNPPFQVYSAQVEFQAMLTGWRYWVRRFPISSGIVLFTVSSIFGSILLTLFIIIFCFEGIHDMREHRANVNRRHEAMEDELIHEHEN